MPDAFGIAGLLHLAVAILLDVFYSGIFSTMNHLFLLHTQQGFGRGCEPPIHDPPPPFIGHFLCTQRPTHPSVEATGATGAEAAAAVADGSE